MATIILEVVPVGDAESDKTSWNHPSTGLVHVTQKRLSGKVERSVGSNGLDRIVSEDIDHQNGFLSIVPFSRFMSPPPFDFDF
jgi:hypothetical protein